MSSQASYFHLNLSRLKDWNMDIKDMLNVIRFVLKNEPGVDNISNRLYSPQREQIKLRK